MEQTICNTNDIIKLLNEITNENIKLEKEIKRKALLIKILKEYYDVTDKE